MANTKIRQTSPIALFGVPLVLLYVGAELWANSHSRYDEWSALVVIPLLILVSVPMLQRAGRRDPDPRFGRLLATAFVLKALSTVARYLMAFVLYDGVADAGVYHQEGERLAASYRAWDFGADIGRNFVGTGFIRVATGAIYTVTGPSIYISYAVFSWLGFWGLYFFYRAFRVGVPDGDSRRYSLLVLLLPSMLFWPSGLGKEAWMTFGLGLTAYGSALLLSSDRRWVLPLLLGLTSTAVVRPHVTAACFAGLAVAYVIRRSVRPSNELTPVARVIAVIVLAGAGLVLVQQAASYLNIKDVNASNVDAAIESTASRTDQGGSSFQSDSVNSPLDFPRAAMSVLVRPFPWEATNAQMLLAAAEGAVLSILILRSRRRVISVPGRLRRQPYLTLCLTYSALFVYAFSNFSNFGILTRERVMVVPFVLVFLALPMRKPEEAFAGVPASVAAPQRQAFR